MVIEKYNTVCLNTHKTIVAVEECFDHRNIFAFDFALKGVHVEAKCKGYNNAALVGRNNQMLRVKLFAAQGYRVIKAMAKVDKLVKINSEDKITWQYFAVLIVVKICVKSKLGNDTLFVLYKYIAFTINLFDT
jgi:hypothetical protein